MVSHLGGHVVDNNTTSGPRLGEHLSIVCRVCTNTINPRRLVIHTDHCNTLGCVRRRGLGGHLLKVRQLIFRDERCARRPRRKRVPTVLSQLRSHLTRLLTHQTIRRHLREGVSRHLRRGRGRCISRIGHRLLRRSRSSIRATRDQRGVRGLRTLSGVDLAGAIVGIMGPNALSRVIKRGSTIGTLTSGVTSPCPRRLVLCKPPNIKGAATTHLILRRTGGAT